MVGPWGSWQGAISDKIQDLIKIPESNWKEVAGKLSESMSVQGKDWGLHNVFVLELQEYEMAILGTTGARMDSRSFEIVGAGSDGSRGDLKFPGLAHAAAYPLEVVVRQDGDSVRVQMVDAMFRMKMYFEDAGKMAFMKNMGMPGSIADEIKGQVKAALPEVKN